MTRGYVANVYISGEVKMSITWCLYNATAVPAEFGAALCSTDPTPHHRVPEFKGQAADGGVPAGEDPDPGTEGVPQEWVRPRQHEGASVGQS